MLKDKIRLLHIRDAIESIKSYSKDADFTAFMKNRMMFDACCRQLEIIGEAANHISKDLEEANPQIPWAFIVAFRNVVVHQYFGLDERTVWDIIQNNLPQFEAQIKALLSELNNA